ncbi:uncharacterized mitochondrial protein AtMg00810-like [Glycine max]|uniref:uncharacterized mitochondrial protein AtMg00810-like n=1 Tax=Glycine max TaxID=3847 RepID=UPI0007193344|nr:uncharacterized mitochondrial protein AtMg00810-like [Glycine max]|eukprot:XP_014629703.1 uncharacterized protein LOC106798236 [Glycine max]
MKKGKEEKVYKLRKALYGLKQAPRAWYSKIEAYFVRNGFERCFYEHTLFTKSTEGEFDMIDLGRIRYFLRVEILQNAHGIFICQRKYAREVLPRFGMKDCNAVKNPIVPRTQLSRNDAGTKVDATLFKQVVGSLMYLTAMESA